MPTRPDPLLELSPRHEVSRRDALKLIASGIAALRAGCLSRAGDEDIVPYVKDPPEQRPGRTVRYASMLTLDGFATGIVVETHEGRPTKIDGHPLHPATRGGSTPWMQARILDLYDPQRSATPRLGRAVTSWAAVARRLRALPPGPLWLVLPPQSSPTVGRLLERLRAQRELHVVYHAPIDHRVAYRAAAAVFGRPLEVQLDLAHADVVVSLDADFLSSMPMSPSWARAFAARRDPAGRMNRLWTCEPMETATTTLADERRALPASDVSALAACILAELGARRLPAPRLPASLVAQCTRRLGEGAAWARAAAADLATHRGAGATIVGDRQPWIVHALARWIDHACGNAGRAVACTAPALLDPLADATLADLAHAARAGASVIVIDCDPVYTAPRSLDLAGAFAASPLAVHVGLHAIATAQACAAHVPLAHELETWSDGRAWDGTLSIGQPLVRPRFDIASTLDVLAALVGDPRGARELVREPHGDEVAWTDALRAGFVAGSQAPREDVTPTWPAGANDALAAALAVPTEPTYEIALAPSPQVGDGRFAANAWLQELPHPITKQTWGNAALLAQETARALGVDDGDRLQLATDAGTVIAPVIVVAGAAPGSITLELGHGQHAPSAPIANRVGADGYALRGGETCVLRGTARRVPGTTRLARTQTTFGEHGREVAPTATLAAFHADRNLVAHLRRDEPSLLPAQPREGTQWGMSIDTSICTGCSACMVACQAENNIATVGAGEVANGRHMNWLRIDRYVDDQGGVVNEPMPCQHCENAPCEYVCPTMATTHSPDGLNEQVYNRCVGTRFCSNNCPYKVRRFNWFTPEKPTTRALQFNPDVTVRSRGVMEKCTYCVQRIRRAEQTARVEHRELRAGEVATACQQACPTGAIQFGELHEQGTPFARLRRDARRFEALHDLGTKPRTQYLAKIRNPRGSR